MISTATMTQQPQLRALRRFVRSPKGYLLLVLAVLAAAATPFVGPNHAVPNLASAVIAAALADVAIVRYSKGTWFFPSGAILTGLLVALVLSPDEPWYVEVGTAAFAIGSKYVFRSRWANVFNPAALALVVSFYVFGSGQSWWGALPDLPTVALVLVLATGLLVGNHVNKLPMIMTFVGCYFALFTLVAFLGNPSQVSEIFRAPDLNAALFFAFFMLDDPPTSPVRYPDQMLYGMVVALASLTVFLRFGVAYYLLAGVLVGNLWEASRRWIENGDAKRVAS